jgi:hypothetical protein
MDTTSTKMYAHSMIQPMKIDAWLTQFQSRECKAKDSIVGMTCWNTFG